MPGTLENVARDSLCKLRMVISPPSLTRLSPLSHGWVDSLHIAEGDPAQREAFLSHLKRHGL
ncbi:MAG: hypothetical protein ACOC9D_02085, partial [Thermodesulfobacteriota bacterium]